VKLYEVVDVWRREADGSLLRFRCFRVLPEGTFCVQSADHYRASFPPGHERQMEEQFRTLLGEEAPDVRGHTWPTLEQAISAFEREFENIERPAA